MYPFLSDMQRFVEVHPVVYKIDKLKESEYLFYEKIKFGFIPYAFKYKVSLKKRIPDQFVEMESQVQKGVHLTLKFSFKSSGGFTQVEEEVVINSNFLVKIIFQTIITKAHKKLFQNIENYKSQ